ncbi:hypothetical protein E2C01_025769 [Portunus trituberculatus]|uniref:Uncharacterized protein n=1 Tax=Portunus trituberculatus TaxID=210409 RepID=A0A5B7EGC1_PORTR|nr:hypothetical protein [Portunus trituberculatus]
MPHLLARRHKPDLFIIFYPQEPRLCLMRGRQKRDSPGRSLAPPTRRETSDTRQLGDGGRVAGRAPRGVSGHVCHGSLS